MSRLMTRKDFLKSVGLGACAVLCADQAYCFWPLKSDFDKSVKGDIFKGDAPSKPWKWSVEAFHYETEGKTVRCQLCPHQCYLFPGGRSVCRVRGNICGKVYSLSYGVACSVHIYPI